MVSSNPPASLPAAAICTVVAPNTAAVAAAHRRWQRPVGQHPGHTMVAAPSWPTEHQGITAVQEQGRGRHISGGAAEQEDCVAAQREADQGLVQAALGVVAVPVQGVTCWRRQWSGLEREAGGDTVCRANRVLWPT